MTSAAGGPLETHHFQLGVVPWPHPVQPNGIQGSEGTHAWLCPQRLVKVQLKLCPLWAPYSRRLEVEVVSNDDAHIRILRHHLKSICKAPEDTGSLHGSNGNDEATGRGEVRPLLHWSWAWRLLPRPRPRPRLRLRLRPRLPAPAVDPQPPEWGAAHRRGLPAVSRPADTFQAARAISASGVVLRNSSSSTSLCRELNSRRGPQ